jgi:hypothetical protein
MGSFTVTDVELSSDYVELMADGFYFDENRGRITNGKLLLKAIADVSVQSEININILTHISVERVKYLIQDEGKTFSEAKSQSRDEIMKIFNLNGEDTCNYERLDISQEGELNSKLLAISSIVQGNRDIASLTELITAIGSDIRTDGVIDSKDLQTKLATSAVLCNIGSIRTNLADYYSDDSVFNDFQNYVKQFIENTEFESLIDLDFPASTPEGVNLLALPDNSTLDTDAVYCLSQNLNSDHLDGFNIQFTIIKTSETGTVNYSVIDLNGWEYESNYCSSEPFFGLGCGIGLYLSYNRLVSSTSKIPLSLSLQGSGELLLIIYIDSASLPDNGGSYMIRKYMHW